MSCATQMVLVMSITYSDAYKGFKEETERRQTKKFGASEMRIVGLKGKDTLVLV